MQISKTILTPEIPNPYIKFDFITSRNVHISILTLGASISRVSKKSTSGVEQVLSLSFSHFDNYKNNPCYSGCTLGPNAGRIRNGVLPIHKNYYSLTKNDTNSQLHGGFKNLSTHNWTVKCFSYNSSSVHLCLFTQQSHGVDGYPGNRNYYVMYSLNDNNWLKIEYFATTDCPTYINMSNHTYWNLSANFSTSIFNHQLQIFAKKVCINDKNHLPIDIIPVSYTVFDFQSFRSLSSMMLSNDTLSQEQLKIGKGFNNAYILNSFSKSRKYKHTFLSTACIVKDPSTNNTLTLLTDAPALVLYTGGYLPNNIVLDGNFLSSPNCALALEAQDIPNVMHLLPSAYHLTLPHRPFHRKIAFHIS